MSNMVHSDIRSSVTERRITIIEPDTTLRQHYIGTFERLGYNVEVAGAVEELPPNAGIVVADPGDQTPTSVFVRRFQSHNPLAKLLVSSRSGDILSGTRYTRYMAIAKPCSVQEIVDAVAVLEHDSDGQLNTEK